MSTLSHQPPAQTSEVLKTSEVWRGLTAALAVALTLAAATPAVGQAPRLLFSHRPAEGDAVDRLLLRPNVVQEVFLFVKNDGPRERTVTVELLLNGAPILSQKVQAASGAVQRVALAKPPAPGVPPPKPEEQKGTLTFRLLDDKNAVLQTEEVRVSRPSEYINVSSRPVFYTGGEGGATNRLAVGIKPRVPFKGPRCFVELVILPERIPGFKLGQPKRGIYGGFLTGDPNQELILVAEDLQFEGDRTRGPVYLRVDGYDRAFAFDVTFLREGTSPVGDPVNKAGLRIDAPAYATPDAPVKVDVEVDNLPIAARAMLEVLVAKDAVEVKQDRYNEMAVFRSDRPLRLLFSPVGPGGGLLFEPVVGDWTTNVDLKGIHGQTRLRLRVLDKDGKEVEVRDNRKGELAPDGAVFHTLRLDASPPAAVRFVEPPLKARPGAVLDLRATCADPLEHIATVEFFPGKPKDGKPAAGVDSVFAEVVDREKNLWAAELRVPHDRREPLDVNVLVKKKAGGIAIASIQVEIEDPNPAAKPPPGPASVTGFVMEGSRPQSGLTVVLQDERGEVKGQTKTDEKGQFAFKDLAPGRYTLSAAKSASNTRGSITVELKADEKRVLEPKDSIKLYR